MTASRPSPWDALLDAEDRLREACCEGRPPPEMLDRVKDLKLESALLFFFLLSTARREDGVKGMVAKCLDSFGLADQDCRLWVMQLEQRMERMQSDMAALVAENHKLRLRLADQPIPTF